MATTVEQLITRSTRMMGIIGDGATLSASEADDALTVFNQVQRSLFGTLIGVKLSPETVATGTVRNGALYESGAATATLTCPANPKAGWRFGVSDARGTLSGNAVTVAPNTRKFKGSTSNATLNTNGLSETYFFRDDTGDWVLEADLALTDNVYFPDELMGGLAAMLAVALANEYGKEAPPATQRRATEGEAAFAHRYGRAGTIARMLQAQAPAA